METLNDLKPWVRNPRKISEQAKAGLKKSLEEFGDLSGIVFNAQLDALVTGHQRTSTLPQDSKIEIEKVYETPTRTGTVAEGYITIDGERLHYREVKWDEMKHAAANIAANNQKIAGEFTEELGTLLDELSISMPGFNKDLRFDDLRCELKQLWESTVKEDEVPETPKTARTKAGTVYELGDHRLMCGDSTSEKDAEMLMQGEKAQLVFTDAPYNVDYHSAAGRGYESKDFGGDGNAIFNDNLSDEDCLKFYTNVLSNLYKITKEDAAIYWWFATKNQHLNRQAFIDSKWHVSQMVIWLKNHFVLARGQEYHRIYEPCLVGWKKGNKHYSNRSLNTLSDLFSLDYEDFQQQFDVWYERRDVTNYYVHPTQKPVRLSERAIRKNSRVGDLVLDVFGGSGSTLIGAIQLKRRCYLMELDPKYCDVIVTRYCNFIGSNKIKVNGESTNW